MATEAETLASLPPPEPTLPQGKGRMSMSDIMGFQKPFLERKTALQQEITKAKGDELKAKQAQTELLAEKNLGVEQQYGGQERAAREEYKQVIEKEPLPAFIPSKDTAQDMAGLFSLINVMGMLMGGQGKQAAVGALGAMNGMLEGYQKGRADLYKKQRDEFDKNFKVMQQKHAEFRKEMEDAIKLAATDKQAGLAAANVAAAKAGSSIVQAQLRKGSFVDAYKLIEESQTGANKALDFVVKQKEAELREAAAERRHRENMNQRERMAKEQNDLRERLAKISADAKGKGTGLKPSAKITEGYIADSILKSDVDSLRKDLQNPALQEQIVKYRVEAFLTEESKILNQVLSTEIPSELRQFLTKVRDIRNNYYLNISGKAVTGGEALRNYGTVPQPGDDPKLMIDKLSGMYDRINDTINIKQQLFNLPDLNLRPGTKPPELKPGDDYTVSSQKNFEVGKVYTDKSGNKAKYLGNDEWEEQ